MTRSFKRLAFLTSTALCVAGLSSAARAQALTGVPNLNTSNFTLVEDVDFTKMGSLTDLQNSPMSDIWGNTSDFWFSGSSGLAIYNTSYTTTGSNGTAFMEPPSGKAYGHGYGLYQFTGSASVSGQGAGICFELWPADNVWLPSQYPDKVSELDVLETFGGATATGQINSTFHYWDANASGNNGQTYHNMSGIDVLTTHTYSIDWEAGSITYYVDGVPYYQDTSSLVPADAAHGGVNKAMGVGLLENAGPAGLYVTDVRYSSPNAGGTTPPANEITLIAPSGNETAGTAFSLSFTDNYSVTGATVYDGSTALTGTTLSGETVSGIDLTATGSHSLTVHGQDGTVSNAITVNVVAASTPSDTITLGTLPSLTSGTNATLPFTTDYALSGSTISVSIAGVAYSLPVTLVSTDSYTVAVPGTDLPAGSDAIFLQDGSNATSPTVTATVASAPTQPNVTGSMSAPGYFVGGYLVSGPQDMPVTLGSAVTSADVDFETGSGTPTLGGPNDVSVVGIGTSTPYAPSVPVSGSGGAGGSVYLSLNKGPFVQQFSVGVYGQTAGLTLNQPTTPLVAGATQSITATANYTPGNPAAMVVSINGVESTSNATLSGSTVTVPLNLAAGTYSIGLFDGGKTLASPISVTVAAATAPPADTLSLTGPSSLVSGSGATLVLTSDYAITASDVTVKVGSQSYSLAPTAVSGQTDTYDVALPAADLPVGTDAVTVSDGSNATSNSVSIVVSAPPPADSITLGTLPSLTAGTNAVLPFTSDYAITASDVSVSIAGTAYSLPVTAVSGATDSYTVAVPGADIPAGSDAIFVQDGTNATSNTVTVTAASAAPTYTLSQMETDIQSETSIINTANAAINADIAKFQAANPGQ